VLDQAPAARQDRDDDTPAADGGRAGLTPGKGKPTPKRSAAQQQRRHPQAPPASGRKGATAAGGSKAQVRAERMRRNEAMRRGEDWALPRKDQGKVRALARDFVDSRRSVSEFYLFAVGALFLMLIIPGLKSTVILQYVQYVILVLFVVVAGEGWLTGRRVLRLVQQRHPGESTRGVRLYAALRSTQWRKLRSPAPRVKLGHKL